MPASAPTSSRRRPLTPPIAAEHRETRLLRGQPCAASRQERANLFPHPGADLLAIAHAIDGTPPLARQRVTLSTPQRICHGHSWGASLGPGPPGGAAHRAAVSSVLATVAGPITIFTEGGPAGAGGGLGAFCRPECQRAVWDLMFNSLLRPV